MSEFIEFTCNSAAVKAALEQCAERILIESAAMLESQVKRNTVVDSAHTKESWDHVIDLSKNEAIVGSPLENAVWEEFGTGDYAVKGGRKGKPWYVPVEVYAGKKKPTYNGKVVIVYGKNGRMYYKTNGKKPRRALHKAFESKKSAVMHNARKIVKEEMK